ncbi:hypothetical protein [Tissierella praeacuta]|uniref:hypothetical protein n=1 Tax=Tissierella praeacuta TaxID=43131 RepID=UPI001C1132EA|nr:hypothetical protein [Tissierella praeacuta]MBU5254936.1 hypothetical protein [Tissierella praeacuta]
MFQPNINIVINSNKEIFIFKLSKDEDILYTIFDSSLNILKSEYLYTKNILKYSTFIDENNIIHLIALINTGELNYYKYINGEWSKAKIAKFNMKSNIYNQVEILMIKNKLHILYNYSNLINSNIWTIQHVIYGSEEKYNAIRYISNKTPDPFVVDVDSQGNIHLLYRSNMNTPQIYHSFYSPYTKSWSSLSKQISSDNYINFPPFLFIDSQDNLHGLWLEKLDDKEQVKYLKMSSSGKEKYIWKDIKLPYTKLIKYTPIIFEENNKLKLVFISEDNMELLYSLDHGNSWLIEKRNENLNENIILAKIKSNINKINYIYCNPSDSIKLYFLDSFLYKEPQIICKNSLSELEEKETPPESMKIKSDFTNELEDKFDNILDSYKYIESILSQILYNQEDIQHKLDNIITQNSIDSTNTSFFRKLFK